MSKELIIKKCIKCGATVKVLVDCNCGGDCGIKCCGEKMEILMPNSTDAAVEKHVPTYEIKNDKIIVKVNHVMEEEHNIEWISMVSDQKEETVYFVPGQEAVAEFKYIPNSTIYSYCNKHGLWKAEIK